MSRANVRYGRILNVHARGDKRLSHDIRN